jgi:hypothetical protein
MNPCAKAGNGAYPGQSGASGGPGEPWRRSGARSDPNALKTGRGETVNPFRQNL